MWQRLGQHFLHDITVLNEIVMTIRAAVESQHIHQIIEIWPGQGALTRELLAFGVPVVAIEKDLSMTKYLNPLLTNGLSVIRQDILEVDIANLWESGVLDVEKTLVVGNLPYYITSPIFRKFFETAHEFPGGVFLIQKEVAEKIITGATKKSYLRRLLNIAYDIEYCFTVPSQVFTPPPKVESAVVFFRKKDKPILSKKDDKAKLIRILDLISPYKRKTLGKIEKLCQPLVSIPANLHHKRVEELWWEEMKAIIDEN